MSKLVEFGIWFLFSDLELMKLSNIWWNRATKIRSPRIYANWTNRDLSDNWLNGTDRYLSQNLFQRELAPFTTYNETIWYLDINMSYINALATSPNPRQQLANRNTCLIYLVNLEIEVTFFLIRFVNTSFALRLRRNIGIVKSLPTKGTNSIVGHR